MLSMTVKCGRPMIPVRYIWPRYPLELDLALTVSINTIKFYCQGAKVYTFAYFFHCMCWSVGAVTICCR